MTKDPAFLPPAPPLWPRWVADVSGRQASAPPRGRSHSPRREGRGGRGPRSPRQLLAARPAAPAPRMTVYIPGGRGTPASSRAEGSRSRVEPREVGPSPLHASQPVAGARTGPRVAAPCPAPGARSSGGAWAVSGRGEDARRDWGDPGEEAGAVMETPARVSAVENGPSPDGEEEPRGSEAGAQG